MSRLLPVKKLLRPKGRTLFGAARAPSPGAGNGYVYFDNSAGILASHPNPALASLPLGNILMTFTDINGLERPLTMAGGL